MSKLYSPLNTGQLELLHRVVLSCSERAGTTARSLARYATTGGLMIGPARRPETLGAFVEQVRRKGGVVLARIHLAGAVRPTDRPGLEDALGCYRAAGLAARAAGFSGVELDAGVGTLPWRLLRDANGRGSGAIDEGVSFLAEAVQAVIDTWGPELVGVRIAPPTCKWDLDEAGLERMVVALTTLHDQEVAFVHLAGDMAISVAPPAAAVRLRQAFPDALIVDGDGTEARAQAAVNSRWADAVSFETYRLNPKIVARLRRIG